MRRLTHEVLAELAPQTRRPRYDPATLQHGIVHLGIGAFARAHLAVATEAVNEAGHDRRWGIVGVSLRSRETRDALAPQGGLYTLALRDADVEGAPRERLQVVGTLVRLLVAPEDPAAVLEAIAAAETRIVSLTVTEKGYHREPAGGELQLDDADIAHDLAQPAAPSTALGFIVRGLALRRARHLGPITLLSCDNLPANGAALRRIVHAFAQCVDPTLAAWIDATCSFPNSMVDRIVPRTTADDRASVARALGVHDAWPVIAEPFFDWAIEDRFAAGRPDWTVGGARFVADAEPFERLKLRMVNGSHSAIAYLGVVAGWPTVDAAMAVPALRRFVDRLLRDEIAPTLPPLQGLDLDAYRARLLDRFANPALRHRTLQIAMDGLQKLPQRLLATVRDRLAAGAPIECLGLAIAAWLRYLQGCDEAGNRHPIEDPLAEVLGRCLAQADAAEDLFAATALLCGYTPVFGDLGADARFVECVARHRESLRERGVSATLAALG